MKVDVAIITIRPDEFKAVRERFKTTHRSLPGGHSYLMGEVKTCDDQSYTIALARCVEQGNDVSQKLAGQIIHDLNPEIILVVGIAGGVPHDEFTLGDVVVSTRIENLNLDALNADGTTAYAPRGGPLHPVLEDIVSLLPGDPALEGWAKPESVGLERPAVDLQQTRIEGDDEWRARVRQSLTRHFSEARNQNRPPTFMMGPVISSNHLVKDPAVLRNWLKVNRSVLAVEMELAGVYEAAQTIKRQYPVLAIRGISDIVGHGRDSRWTAYACQTAAAFTCAFIRAIRIPRREEKGEGYSPTTSDPPRFDLSIELPWVLIPDPPYFVGMCISILNQGLLPSYIDLIEFQVLVDGKLEVRGLADIGTGSKNEFKLQRMSCRDTAIPSRDRQIYPYYFYEIAEFKRLGRTVVPVAVQVKDKIGNVYRKSIPEDMQNEMAKYFARID